jgi:predicted Zn-dependent protease
MVNRLFAIAFIIWMLFSCATTHVAPVGKQESFKLQDDERRIWNRSKEEQDRLNRSNLIYDDPALTAYLNEVVQNLIPKNVKDKGLSIEVKIIKNPLLNAFAYPNGVIYVHTGILAKMDNEAQLSTLLGHEMTHVTHRHAVQQFRTVKNTTAVLATIQMASVPFGVYGSLANVLGTVGAMASVTGYSRELETEADRVGLGLMADAGYDPQETPKLFVYLKSDLEKNDVKEPFFFGSHPRLQERIINFENYLASDYSGKTGVKGGEKFNRLIAPLLLDNAMMDLDMGRYSSAQEGVEKFLKLKPSDARGHYCLGEIYRQRGEKEDSQKAEEEYRQALSCDPNYPLPRKGLGIIYLKQGMKNKSVDEFEKYLQLLPDALDRAYIKQYIQHLKTE